MRAVDLTERIEIVALDSSEIDRVEGLWKEMVAVHREVTAGEWPVRSAGDAWARRRIDYEEILGEDGGRMLVALPARALDDEPLGYAALTVRKSGATWDMGELVGELESLSVAAAHRGRGIGTALLGACRDSLRAEGIVYWGVGVVEANEGATRLYEKAGFRPYYRLLKARIDQSHPG